MPTLNVTGLRDLVTMLRELEAADRFWMEYWALGPVNPTAETWRDCGTVFCAAGAQAAADGWRPQYRTSDDGHHLATGMFVRPDNRNYDGTDPWLARSAYGIAIKSLGLTQTQGFFLFYPERVSRVDDFAARVEHVIAHPGDRDPGRTYPVELLDAELEHYADDRDTGRLDAMMQLADDR